MARTKALMNLPSTSGAIASTSMFLTRKEFASFLYAVDSGWRDLNVLEASNGKFGAVFILFESARNAANPEKHALADLRWHLATGHNVGYSKTSARLQNAEGLPQHSIFVRRN